MKNLLFLTLAFMSIISFGQKSNDSMVIERKLDSILTSTRIIQNQKIDSALIKIDKLDGVFKRSEQNGTDKSLPAIIALFTVIISSGVAVYVGVRTAKTQIANAETQAKSQIRIAADQIEISRKQIEQNTINTLAQVKANNIAKARIDWIQNLRPIIGDFIANTSKTSIILTDAVNANKQNEKEKALKYMDEFIESMHLLHSQNNQILLYLNPERLSHKKLEESMTVYLNSLVLDDNFNKQTDEGLFELILENSRYVIKEAWEQAKSDTNI